MKPTGHRRVRPKNFRHGYSLIEMILATAILAASGLALQTLLAQASRLALRSEQHTLALQLAESLIDEALAIPPRNDRTMESTFAHDDRWSYRLRIETIADIRMSRMTVEVFVSENTSSQRSSIDQEPLCRLVRWVRTSQMESKSSPMNQRPTDPSPATEKRRR